jgi:hypothetical protein
MYQPEPTRTEHHDAGLKEKLKLKKEKHETKHPKVPKEKTLHTDPVHGTNPEKVHKHETAKGAAAGAAIASVVPVAGTVVGGAVGAVAGHHEKKKHMAEGTHDMDGYHKGMKFNHLCMGTDISPS